MSDGVSFKVKKSNLSEKMAKKKGREKREEKVCSGNNRPNNIHYRLGSSKSMLIIMLTPNESYCTIYTQQCFLSSTGGFISKIKHL